MRAHIATIVAAALVAAAGLRAQTAVPAAPQVLDDSLVGADSFARYCAACHGTSGRGDGPVAGALRTRPADLTTLARRNGGGYPRERVRETVLGTGRMLTAHGTTEMPIWGPLFRAFEREPRVAVRVDNLVGHVETLQQPSTAPGDPGATLFRTYCASCHGADARGSGPMTALMRQLPPDLTAFSRRNGGVFPGERVRRIVDGRDVASHGDRAMPVWGDAFRRSEGLTTDAAAARIDAIVRYLERIQERGAE